MPFTFLALGDSYTIGEGVAFDERWPLLLVELLRARRLDVASPRIIARTGWTTAELTEAVAAAAIGGRFDLVSLLIGVNDQYRGSIPADYRKVFSALLKTAIGFAGGNARRVVVLSIPDWGATPFAEGRDRAAIAAEIDRFNDVNRQESRRLGASCVDITGVSRSLGADRQWLAADLLHPGPAMHRLWAEAVVPVAARALYDDAGERG